ncbi:cupin [Ahniella affigens]|uniref:Cupin n=1 Tax=Ahniella affigens TaxID=2021234 RepID=A0A2P1PVF7_9GAMM|nr:cupin domain-containing protein [Ahniella affigens]AVP98764.1 cupin [Ahniella affigens]
MRAKTHVVDTFVHVRPDGCLTPIPVTDTFWQALAQGQLGELNHGYLLSSFRFSENWTSWERHPAGDEWVCLLSGVVTLILEQPDGLQRCTLAAPGDFLVVPQGIWHSADATADCTLLFLTPGAGTEHRPRHPKVL